MVGSHGRQLCAAAVAAVRLIRGHGASDSLPGLGSGSLEAVDDATRTVPPGGARFENVCSVAVTRDVTVMKKREAPCGASLFCFRRSRPLGQRCFICLRGRLAISCRTCP